LIAADPPSFKEVAVAVLAPSPCVPLCCDTVDVAVVCEDPLLVLLPMPMILSCRGLVRARLYDRCAGASVPFGTGGSSVFVMPGRRDVLRILLPLALEAQEVVIAAAAFPGERAADARACLIDGAAARLGIEEAADASEMRIRLAP